MQKYKYIFVSGYVLNEVCYTRSCTQVQTQLSAHALSVKFIKPVKQKKMTGEKLKAMNATGRWLTPTFLRPRNHLFCSTEFVENNARLSCKYARYWREYSSNLLLNHGPRPMHRDISHGRQRSDFTLINCVKLLTYYVYMERL